MIQTLFDTEIRTEFDPANSSQVILIQPTELGERLARLLGEARISKRQGYLVVPHTPEVDEILIQLVDAMVDIRYSHPRLMQLRLALPEPAR